MDKKVVILVNANNLQADEQVFPPKEEILNYFKENFKRLGYLKTKQTWRKHGDDVTLVCNIQNSQWSKEDYYINCGVLIEKLKDLPHNYGTFEIRATIFQTAEQTFEGVNQWLNRYDTLDKVLKACANYEFENGISYCNMILSKMKEIKKL